MIRKDIKSTKIYTELFDCGVDFFSYKDKKFVHNIDTFYYSIFIKDDVITLEENSNLNKLILHLSELKQKVTTTGDSVYFIKEHELLLTRKRFKIYDFCLTVNNMFDIFISSYLPNLSTPRIVVQLRSIGLWTNGERDLIERSYYLVNSILNEYGLEISKTQENRIDYAYHTNYIQNPVKYFDDKVIRDKLDTTFDIYKKVGRKNKKKLTIEYLSLGQRTSNNLFFRTYNKTREVIEENYKGFFIDYWYREGLISLYDKFVLEYAYKKGRYDSIEWGKLEFYLKYGQDHEIKEQIELLKRDYRSNLDYVREFTKDILPNVTLIMNIEFQTMRKFYYTSDNFIDTLETKEFNTNLKRLFKIIDNRKIFLDYLTSNTVVFKKNDVEIADWWKRLSNLKLHSNSSNELLREYGRNLDIDKLKQKLKGTVASLNMYMNREDTLMHDDFSAMLCCLNDNDIENLNFVSSETGELIELVDCEYNFIKEKKKKSLKSLVRKLNKDS